MGDLGEHIPPQSIEAERSVLGAMMLVGEAASLAVEALVPEDFYRSGHKRIFGAMRKLCLDGESPDEVLVRELLERYGVLEEVGGSDYIHELASCVPSAANMERYAGIVKEKSTVRRLISACTASLREASDGGDVGEMVSRAHARVCEVALQNSKDSDPASMDTIMPEVFEEMMERHANPTDVWGLATGLRSFDLRTGGLHPAHLYILAARRSIGKSALALTFLNNICCSDEPKSAVLFSLEMGRRDVARRLVSMRTGLSFQALCSGHIPADKWDGLLEAQAQAATKHLIIDDTAGIGLPEVQAKARRLCAQNDIKVAIVDYLQIMSPPKAQSREREVAQISAGLKTLARELEIPVIALSQFRRAKLGEKETCPHLDDLRDSGALEQDADVVVILHRKRNEGGWYETDTRFDIAKQRNGPTGWETVLFQKERMRFVDRTYEEGA